jgi:hypothetical protein
LNEKTRGIEKREREEREKKQYDNKKEKHTKSCNIHRQ